jgi:hypothetical protein
LRCKRVAERHSESKEVKAWPATEIDDSNKVLATPIEKVYEHGFYPLQCGFRVDPNGPGVVRRELRINPGQIQQSPNLPNEMIVRNRLIEPKLVKELPLVLAAPPHHGPPLERTGAGALATGELRAGNRSPAVHAVSAAKRLSRRQVRALAESVVTSELFSKSDSLLSRENTGNFRDSRPLTAR